MTLPKNSNPTSIIRKNVSPHGFVSAIIHSYNLHQHLRFSPDDVWLTVAQGVSRHILNNSERFRYLFVDHEGKKDIKINANDILECFNGNFHGDWPQVISRLSVVTDERIKKVGLKQHLECDFSTSTNASITASQIILFDAMKKYFNYKVYCLCGIPKVTLDGTLEDWLHLQEKVAKIRDLGLELDFWLDRLEPVITQFVSTYKGDVDEKFWSIAVYNVPYGSDGDSIPYWNGWIGALFPYDNSERKITKNEIVPDEVPSGLVHVPFELITLEDGNGVAIHYPWMDLLSRDGESDAIIHAYTLHQHLRFSPDDVLAGIFLLIQNVFVTYSVSGHIFDQYRTFSLLIRLAGIFLINTERFRYLFVDHEGQKDVTVDARDIIRPQSSKMPSRVTFGIPQTPRKLLKPVIAQFVSTYKGDVDEKFWSMAVFEIPYDSGGPSLRQLRK
ncbi:10117_t:CDS:2 [Diversispora eburnea]|uniref:10117_t:CDS:1 n=1 Tax=Diversispora eburnea TaxID=1213867 RepID=A0A9N8V9B8_9GLOM|nr:10117_t:CDS:2 [Diversispora eburnea]